MFDHLYVQFYNNFCSRNGPNGDWFDSALRSWLNFANRHNIKVFMGIIAHRNAIFNAYRDPPALDIEYKVRNKDIVQSETAMHENVFFNKDKNIVQTVVVLAATLVISK